MALKVETRAVFGSATPSSAPDLSPGMGPLRLDLDFPNGRARLSVEGVPTKLHSLAGTLLAVVWYRSQVGQPLNSRSSARSAASAIRSFAAFLAEVARGRAPTTIGDLQGHLIDDFLGWLSAEQPDRSRNGTEYTVSAILSLLGSARQLGLTLSDSMRDRLESGLERNGVPVPREPYSEGECARLEAACLSQLQDAIRRITIVGKTLVDSGADPAVRGWEAAENLLWLIASRGTISQNEIVTLGGHAAENHSHGRLTELHHYLYPSSADCLAALVLFCLRSGLESECVASLTVDSLSNRRSSQATLEYMKLRAHGNEVKNIPIRLGGLGTPGGVFHTMQRLSQHARAITGRDALFQYYGGGHLRVWANSVVHAGLGNAFVSKFELKADSGHPLRLGLSRIRKSHKAARYKRAGGHMTSFVDRHSADVAARHYANVDSLRPTHEAAIERALHEALAPARGPTVVSVRDGDANADATGTPPSNDRSAPHADHSSGSTDLWLASCNDFYNSPFGPGDAACPVPFFGCIECRNAIIAVDKLPAILAFLAHITQQRSEMDSFDWSSKFGGAWAQLVHNIVPRFTETEIAEARCIAEAAGSTVPDLVTLLATIEKTR